MSLNNAVKVLKKIDKVNTGNRLFLLNMRIITAINLVEVLK